MSNNRILLTVYDSHGEAILDASGTLVTFRESYDDPVRILYDFDNTPIELIPPTNRRFTLSYVQDRSYSPVANPYSLVWPDTGVVTVSLTFCGAGTSNPTRMFQYRNSMINAVEVNVWHVTIEWQIRPVPDSVNYMAKLRSTKISWADHGF